MGTFGGIAKSINQRSIYCLYIRVLVVLLGFGGFDSVHADPRIDQDTAAALTVATHPTMVELEGVASWYGRHWRGRRTASGRVFDDRRLTAASLTLPLNCWARVVNLQNGRWVDVFINDRGPYVAGRVMDLSRHAAALLRISRSGLARVAIVALLAPLQPVKAMAQLAAGRSS